MRDWKLHMISALFLIIIWLAAFNFLEIPVHAGNLVVLVILTLFASLFPDVDMRRSKIRDLTSLILAFAISLVYLFFYGRTWYYAPLYFLILYFVLKYLPTKHRGLTHTFKFSLLFSSSTVYLYHLLFGLTFHELLTWFLIIFLSYNLHLVLDRV